MRSFLLLTLFVASTAGAQETEPIVVPPLLVHLDGCDAEPTADEVLVSIPSARQPGVVTCIILERDFIEILRLVDESFSGGVDPEPDPEPEPEPEPITPEQRIEAALDSLVQLGDELAEIREKVELVTDELEAARSELAQARLMSESNPPQ